MGKVEEALVAAGMRVVAVDSATHDGEWLELPADVQQMVRGAAGTCLLDEERGRFRWEHSPLLMEPREDFARTVGLSAVEGLLDGKGSVRLVDFFPRHVPAGCTPEYMIADAARTSTKVLAVERSAAKDRALVKYLYTNKHTSPFEMCSVTFAVQLPIAIARHFLRHRTAKVNEFSERYEKVPEALGDHYDPLKFREGIRVQSRTNKQASDFDGKDHDDIRATLAESNELLQKLYANYHKSLAQGLAKEIARFYLPVSQYTRVMMQFDLNNLLKMLRLRCDASAQFETQVYANAMARIAKQLFPVSFELWEEESRGMTLSERDIADLASPEKRCSSSSKSEARAFAAKRQRLGIQEPLAPPLTAPSI